MLNGSPRPYSHLPCPTDDKTCTVRWSRRSTGCGPRPYQDRSRDMFDLGSLLWDNLAKALAEKVAGGASAVVAAQALPQGGT